MIKRFSLTKKIIIVIISIVILAASLKLFDCVLNSQYRKMLSELKSISQYLTENYVDIKNCCDKLINGLNHNNKESAYYSSDTIIEIDSNGLIYPMFEQIRVFYNDISDKYTAVFYKYYSDYYIVSTYAIGIAENIQERRNTIIISNDMFVHLDTNHHCVF